MKLTRRDFLAGTAAFALVGGSSFDLSNFNLVAPAAAQTPSQADLMAPSPLGDMVLGDEKAPVTIIEYASMTCSHCAEFHNRVYPVLKSKYIDTGKVRFIFREFPLDPLAAGAFMLARCAGKDKYFPLVDVLFKQQSQWVVQKPIEPLLAIAKQAGFTQQSFDACLSNQEVLNGIESVRSKAADKLGVNSTPTFFINGKMQRGAMTIEDLDKTIEPLLKS